MLRVQGLEMMSHRILMHVPFDPCHANPSAKSRDRGGDNPDPHHPYVIVRPAPRSPVAQCLRVAVITHFIVIRETPNMEHTRIKFRVFINSYTCIYLHGNIMFKTKHKMSIGLKWINIK